VFQSRPDDEISLLTLEIGFLRCPVKVATSAFLDWSREIQSKRGVELVSERRFGPIRELLGALLPLTTVETRRFLFAPTNSKWTAYFENRYGDGGIPSTISYLSEIIGCRGVRATAVRDTIDATHRHGQYGATILEIYSARPTEFVNTERSIFAANDGGKWKFEAHGKPQEFENLQAYMTRRIKERFTPEMLQKYLNALGIDAYDEKFYRPSSEHPAYFIEKHGPTAVGLRKYGARNTM